jgi:hypothetical protein
MTRRISMGRTFGKLILCAWSLLFAASAASQEAKIHHGFLFFAVEKYTMDEKTYGIYDDGHEFQRLIKENPRALEQYQSYRTWHTTALVFTGLSLASFAFGGAYYIFEKDMSSALGNGAGLIGLAGGGGLLALGFVFEFVSWGSLTRAAEIYNKGLMDDGPGSASNNAWKPTLALAPGSFSLTWKY